MPRTQSDDSIPRKQKLQSAKKVAPRLVRLANPYRPTLLMGLAALGLGCGLNLFFPYFFQQVLNGTLGLSFSADAGTIALIIVVLLGLQAPIFYVRHYCFTVVGYRVVADLRRQLFNNLLAQDVAFFDSARTGDLLSRISSDAQLVQNAVAVNMSVAVRYTLQVIGGTVLMFRISPRLGVLIILLVPVLMIAGKIWGKKLRTYSKKMQTDLADATVMAEEALSAATTVKIFAGTNFEQTRFSAAIGRVLQSGESRAHIAALFSSSMVFLLYSSIACMFFYGAYLVTEHKLTTGDLTAFILYGIIVAVSFGFLINVFDEFMHAVGASERIFSLLDSPPTLTSPPAPRTIPTETDGEVQFHNVSFFYPTRPDVQVLHDVSFNIGVGRHVALVGPSGAGKSTVAALIPRFYDPTDGEITYAGQPVKELDVEALRGKISIVSQDPQLFSVSIGENIRYGNLSANREQIIRAARAAHIHEFIESLPDNYDTLVGARGVQLSGGQRQRIAIARALLKNAKFLILDEAMSALDSENEQLIQDALRTLMVGKTTLVIAHRLSTVQHADEVLVMRDGYIAQRGKHDELMDEPGLYRTLVEHQML